MDQGPRLISSGWERSPRLEPKKGQEIMGPMWSWDFWGGGGSEDAGATTPDAVAVSEEGPVEVMVPLAAGTPLRGANFTIDDKLDDDEDLPESVGENG